MNIQSKDVSGHGVKLYVEHDGQEIARAYVYIFRNDLHDRPFGLMEDVHVDDPFQRKGIGTNLVERVIAIAREQGCYKLICTSRYGKENSVHKMYLDLGFRDHGKEFRIDF